MLLASRESGSKTARGRDEAIASLCRRVGDDRDGKPVEAVQREWIVAVSQQERTYLFATTMSCPLEEERFGESKEWSEEQER